MKDRMLPGVAMMAIAGFVAACAAEVSAPVALDSTVPGVAEAGASGAPVARQKARHIVVQPGQSVSRLAAAYQVPQRAIIAANQLTPPYKLATGQRLLIPRSEGGPPAPVASAPRHIVVEPGRSVSRIAAKYRVSERAIIAANHLTPPYRIEIGRRLIIPGSAAPPTRVASAAPEIIPIDGPAPAKSAALPPVATAGVAASRAEGAPSPPPSVSAAAQPPSPESGAAVQVRPTSPAEPTSPSKPTSPTEVVVAAIGAVIAAIGNQSPVIAEPLPAPGTPAATMTAGKAPVPADTTAPPAAAAFTAPTTTAVVPAAAPPGVSCPSGTIGMWSVDVIKAPVYVCRGSRFQG